MRSRTILLLLLCMLLGACGGSSPPSSRTDEQAQPPAAATPLTNRPGQRELLAGSDIDVPEMVPYCTYLASFDGKRAHGDTKKIHIWIFSRTKGAKDQVIAIRSAPGIQVTVMGMAPTQDILGITHTDKHLLSMVVSHHYRAAFACAVPISPVRVPPQRKWNA
jgi:hypothetical protein